MENYIKDLHKASLALSTTMLASLTELQLEELAQDANAGGGLSIELHGMPNLSSVVLYMNHPQGERVAICSLPIRMEVLQ